MRPNAWLVILGLTFFAAACGGSSGGGRPDGGGTTDAGTGPTQTQVTQTIGFDGGTITLDGATVTFPMGALAADTQITLTHTVDAPPSGFTSGARVWQLGPAATAITRPVTVSLPLVGDAGTAAAYWSDPSATGFERLGAQVASGQVTFGVVRLGSGFVGTTAGHDTVTVYGLVATIHDTPSGGTPEATDLRAATVSAYVPNASHGLDPHAATGDLHGIIRATGVPPSPSYVLRFTLAPDDLTFSSHDATMDLTTFTEARPGLATGANGTQLVAHLTGLDPWASGRTAIRLVAPTLGISQLGVSAVSMVTGDTAGDGTFDFQGQPLLTPSDTALVTETADLVDAGATRYQFVIKSSGPLGGVHLADGSPSSTSASLSVLGGPQAHSLPVAVDGTGFQAMFDAMAAMTDPTRFRTWSGAVEVRADPMPAPFTAHATLVYSTSFGDTSTTFDFGDVAYEDPFAMAWHRYVRTKASYSWQLHNTGLGFDYYARMYYADTRSMSEAGSGTIGPKLTGVTDIRINGAVPSQPLTGMGVTPQITWSPTVTTGTPVFYAVTISPKDHPESPIAWYYTQDPEARIPQGILAAGTFYAVTVYAYGGSGYDPSHLRSPVGLDAYSSGVNPPPIQP